MTGEEAAGLPIGLQIPWRRLEWWGAWISIFLTSGAVFPFLLMMRAGGDLGAAEHAALRLLQLPVFAITLILLARHPGQLLLAMRRTLPLVLIVGIAIASTTWSIEPHITLRRAVSLTFTVLFAYLLALRFTPRQLLWLFTSVLALSLALSLLLAVVKPSWAFMPEGLGLRGVYTHKNSLGWTSTLGLLAATACLTLGDRTLRRQGLFLLLVSVVCLVLAKSASSILATATILLLFLFYALLRQTSGLARALLVLVTLQIAALALLTLSEFLVPLLDSLGRDATLTGRVPLWKLVDARIAERPWLGYGYGSFWAPEKREIYIIMGELGWMPPHAHNGYRDILLSFGIPGLALFLLMVVQCIRRGAKLHVTDPDAGWAWLNVVIGTQLVLNLSESTILEANDFLWLMMAMAMIAIASRSAESPSMRAVVPPDLPLE